MKTLICFLLIVVMLFAFSNIAMARSFGHRSHRGHGGYLYPGPFPGPYYFYEPYPYYPQPYPYYNDRCWEQGRWEVNPATGERYFIPGHYVPCY